MQADLFVFPDFFRALAKILKKLAEVQGQGRPQGMYRDGLPKNGGAIQFFYKSSNRTILSVKNHPADFPSQYSRSASERDNKLSSKISTNVSVAFA